MYHINYLVASLRLFISIRKWNSKKSKEWGKRNVQEIYQEFDEHLEPLTPTGEVWMRYENRWENRGWRAWKLDVLQGMRASGVACTNLRFSRRHVENHVERLPPSRCGRIVIVYSSLFRHAFAAPVSSELCLCRCHDYHRIGKGGAYTKVSDLARSFFATTCPPKHGVTRGSR